MDTDTILALGRVMERILVILVSGLSLAMGWHLYSKGISKKQSAELQHDKIVIRLTDVGPGAFFAILGGIVLVAALAMNLTIPSTPGYADQRGSSYGGELEHKDIDLIKAISTIELHFTDHSATNVSDWDRRGVEQAMSLLSSEKKYLLNKTYPQYGHYLEIKQQIKSGKAGDFSKLDQKTYFEIEQVEARTYGDGS